MKNLLRTQKKILLFWDEREESEIKIIKLSLLYHI